MSARYLVVFAGDGAARDELVERLCSATGLQRIYANVGCAALAAPACRCVGLGERGCILGSLFHRHGLARQLAAPTASEADQIVSSDGQELLRHYWGGYVAVLGGAEPARVVRDPSGVLSCYHARVGAIAMVASDAALLAAAGLRVSIDYKEIGRQFYRANVPAASTALHAVRELLPGFSLLLDGVVDTQEPCWSPWEHVCPTGEEADAAAERLFRVVEHCIKSWSSTASHFLLSVSGGLDSSVVACCLARAGAKTTCLTMFSDDPAGDERVYARALCDHLGLPLVERPYRLEDIDIAEPLAPHLPRPRDRTQANAYERTNLDVASKVGADAFVTGNAGDNVFGYSQSAAPIADRYLSEGLGSAVFQSLLDVCRQTGCSMFDAAGHAWRLAHRSRGHPIAPKPMFLDAEFVASLEPAELHHPWLEAPPNALPGKAAHIASILRALPTLEASRGFYLPVLSPLMSQPIVEACLAVPSWEWRRGGQDRALLRRAFSRELPPVVLDRRVKGTPSRFAAQILDHFRPQIRDRLIGGRLAARGIVDARGLEHVLRGDRPVPDLERVRILELVNAEAWIDHWTSPREPFKSLWPDFSSAADARLPGASGPIP